MADPSGMLLDGMGNALFDSGFGLVLIEIGQQKNQKGQVVGKSHLPGQAVAFPQGTAQSAVIAAVQIKFFEFQLLLVYDNIAKHMRSSFYYTAFQCRRCF